MAPKFALRRWLAAAAMAAGLAVPAPAAEAALPPLEFPGIATFDVLPVSPLVRRAQELLQEFGDYHGAVDGRLNDPTLEAVLLYQRRAGLEADGRVSEALLDHMEFTTRAVALGQRLDAARTEQMAAAEQALLAQPETRDLLARRPAQVERADPTRDVRACFSAPTVGCLLAEALESAKAVHRDCFRDWVLGEIVKVQARLGLADEALETTMRIGDPRLIIAALRDIAAAQAEAGFVNQARVAAAVIPDPVARARALAAVAAAEARAGDAAATAATIAEVRALAARFPPDASPATFLASLAVTLAPAGAAGTEDLIDDALFLAEARGGSGELPGVGTALAAAGREAEAVAILDRLEPPDHRRLVLSAPSATAADAAPALAFARRIEDPQSRAQSLAGVALRLLADGERDAALATLAEAAGDARAVADRLAYTKSHAISVVAAAYLAAGDHAAAGRLSSEISDPAVRAGALWALAAALTAAGSDGGAEDAARAAFWEAADEIVSALDRTWALCNAALRSQALGGPEDARVLLRRALSEAEGIGDAWARSQAVTSVAATLGAVPL